MLFVRPTRGHSGPQVTATTYQLDAFVIHPLEVLVQHDLVYPEGDAIEAELAGDVRPAQLHVHRHDLHGTHAPARRGAHTRVYCGVSAAYGSVHVSHLIYIKCLPRLNS